MFDASPPIFRFLPATAALLLTVSFPGNALAAEVTGSIIDAADGRRVPARLTIESLDDGSFHLADSTGPKGLGAAVPLEKKRGKTSVEIHTALSADPFKADLPPGKYRLTAWRGHEYRPDSVEISVSDDKEPLPPVELKLDRWIHLAERGWFSGDLHCHMPLENLETVVLAADLNVTFPLTNWVTDTTHHPGGEHDKFTEEKPRPFLRFADNTHHIWPVNTEYEIFTHEGDRHVLGAILVLNHRETIDLAVPPLGPMIKEAREQGAIFDLDKHNWPWSMVLPAIGAADTFELTNNHLWRTEFAFTGWYPEYVAEYMGISPGPDGKGFDERGWIDFGMKNWYALLNCGIRIAPSGGTAGGVHPVPLGFGRVYVRLDGREFDYEAWIEGLKAGNSFVTTGPMLFMTVDEQHPGTTLLWESSGKSEKKKKGKDDEEDEEEEEKGIPVILRVESEHEIESLELVINGEPMPLEIGGSIGAKAAHSAMARVEIPFERSGWVAARVFTKTREGRPRFAHTAPVWVEVAGKPQVPKLKEAGYLLQRVEDEIARHKEVLSEEALEEFEKAAEFYREKKEAAAKAD